MAGMASSRLDMVAQIAHNQRTALGANRYRRTSQAHTEYINRSQHVTQQPGG